MTDALGQAIINRRLESKARAGGSFLSASVNQDDVARSADATFVSVTPLGDDWQAALRDVRAVIADALTRAPSQAEIDREIAEMEVAFQVPVEQQRILPGSKIADDLVNALDIRETVAAPQDVLRIFQESKPLFTPEAVLEHTRKLFTGTVTRALFTVQKPGWLPTRLSGGRLPSRSRLMPACVRCLRPCRSRSCQPLARRRSRWRPPLPGCWKSSSSPSPTASRPCSGRWPRSRAASW
ncbi:hypothetical protein ACFSHP_07870 [Novosphingobium panipatense]